MTKSSSPPCGESSTPKRPAVCQSCPQEDLCRKVWSQPSQSHLHGWRLALAGLAGFMLPLVTAAAGSILMRHYVSPDGDHSWRDAAGAVIGLAAGIFPAAWIVRKISQR